MADEKFVIPKEYAVIILRCVPLSVISGLYAIYMGKTYDIVSVPLLVSASSLLYWSHPTYSWRRNLDMTVVASTCTYQAYRGLYAEYSVPYYLFTLLGIACYFIGNHYGKRDRYLGVLCHTGIHIFANIGNIILYSGKIY